MTELEKYVDAVLINNPNHVAHNLAGMGIIDDNDDLSFWDHDDLKNVIVTSNLSMRQLGYAINVPIDHDGYEAQYLSNYLDADQCSTVVKQLINESNSDTSNSSTGQSNFIFTRGMMMEDYANLAIIIFCIIGSIYLIRRM